MIASFSRYARRTLTWPGEDETEDRRLQFLLDVAARYGVVGWSLIPTTDESAVLLERNHTVLSELYRLSTAPWESMRWAYDKRLTCEMADQVGVDQPLTWSPKGREEVASLDCGFPVILKPAVKTANNRFTYARAWRAGTREELIRLYDDACSMVDPDVILVQELIPGSASMRYSYAAVCREGRPLGSMVTRAVRQYPLDFSRFSTFVETVDDPEVEKAGKRLLEEMGYTGIVQVQFKRDSRDGRYKLLDINPRVFGSHSIAPAAGVDLSFMLWRLSQGLPVEEARARPGVRWVRMVGDLLAAARGIQHGDLSVPAYMRSFRRPLEFAIFAGDDPVPALVDVPLLMFMAWKQRGVARRPDAGIVDEATLSSRENVVTPLRADKVIIGEGGS
jgi:D-aspartate ligase